MEFVLIIVITICILMSIRQLFLFRNKKAPVTMSDEELYDFQYGSIKKSSSLLGCFLLSCKIHKHIIMNDSKKFNDKESKKIFIDFIKKEKNCTLLKEISNRTKYYRG